MDLLLADNPAAALTQAATLTQAQAATNTDANTDTAPAPAAAAALPSQALVLARPPWPTPLSAALSDAALKAAWERVQANGGCAGVDHESLASFACHWQERLTCLRAEVTSHRYAPQPLWLVPIPKRQGGQRTLAVPAVRDRVLQTAVAQLIGPHLELYFGADSYGYRPGRSVAQAVARVQAYRNAGLVHVVDADIEHFFDEIDHARLLQLLGEQVADPEIINLVALWLAAVLWAPGRQPRLQTRGVAQGSPLSPLLSNLYLDALDHTLQAAHLAVVRYADDFVVLCPDADAAAQALALVRRTLTGFKLKLNDSKTRLTHFNVGFEFLGVRFERNHVQAVRPQATAWLLPQHVAPEPQAMPAAVGPETSDVPLPRSPAPSEPPIGAMLASLDPALEALETLESPDNTDAASTTAPTLAGAAAVQTRVERASPLLQSLYVGAPGCWLTKEHDRVVVSRDHQVLASVPVGQLDQIAVMDHAMVSTALLLHCARRRVAVVLGGHGAELLTLDSGQLADQRLLQAQWQAQQDPALQRLLAGCFVEGKLHNSCTVLRRFSRREGKEAIEPHLQMIERMQARLVSAPDLNTVRGLEGQAARHYFEALRTLLPMGMDFPGRSRRPPRDPVNVTLSLGYAVLASNLHTLVRLEGLNAHIGHLHATVPAGMALVSDLMEEFRAPVVDAVALNLWRQGQLHDTDFEWSTAPDEAPCRLKSAGRRLFIDALEAKLQSTLVHPAAGRLMDLRRIMQAQVRHYLRVLLREESVYRPFKLR